MCKLDMLFEGSSLASFNCEGYKAEDILKILEIIFKENTKVKNTEVKKVIPKAQEIEEVSMRELGKTIRMPKTTTNFRCPSCGQAILIKIDNQLLCKDIRTNQLHEISIELELPAMINEDGSKNHESIVAVYKDLLECLDDKKLLIESEQNCECPICGETVTTKHFIEAYEKPLDYFDNSDMCNICGDVGTIVLTESGDSVLCDNECYNKLIAK